MKSGRVVFNFYFKVVVHISFNRYFGGGIFDFFEHLICLCRARDVVGVGGYDPDPSTRSFLLGLVSSLSRAHGTVYFDTIKVGDVLLRYVKHSST